MQIKPKFPRFCGSVRYRNAGHIRYVELIYAKMLSDTDSDPVNPLETRKEIYGMAQIAWNISTDSDSLEESLARLQNADSLPMPEELIADIKDWLEVMIEMKWILFAEFATYVDDIEFTELPNGLHDLAIGMSLRVSDD